MVTGPRSQLSQVSSHGVLVVKIRIQDPPQGGGNTLHKPLAKHYPRVPRTKHTNRKVNRIAELNQVSIKRFVAERIGDICISMKEEQ